MSKRRKLEVAVISDLHLGTYGCHAEEVLQYLQSIKPEILVLNGDIIDAWQFKRSYFPMDHIKVIREIINLSTKGTIVYYITGNHDDVLRQFSDFQAGNIHLVDKVTLELDDKRVWIFHGDVFDASVRISPLIARLGGKGYDWLIRINRIVNSVREKLGKPKMSFSKKVKAAVKRAVSFIGDFEDTAINLAADQGFDTVICGHIHQPQKRIVSTPRGEVLYLNSGDWVENLSALEYHEQSWKQYQYDPSHYATEPKKEENKKAESTKTKALLQEILTL